MLQIANNPSSVKTSRDKRVLLQVVLRNLCYEAPLTGVLDQRTVDAIKNMQNDAALISISGEINPNTAYTLYRGINDAMEHDAASDELNSWAEWKLSDQSQDIVEIVKSASGEVSEEEGEEVAAEAESTGVNWKRYWPYALFGIAALVYAAQNNEE